MRWSPSPSVDMNFAVWRPFSTDCFHSRECGKSKCCDASPRRRGTRVSSINSSGPASLLGESSVRNPNTSEYRTSVIEPSTGWPNSSVPVAGRIMSASNRIASARRSPTQWKMPRRSPVRSDSDRTDNAASARVLSVNALRKRIASNRFDFPTPFGPAMHVNGPKRTSTSTKFLNPDTCSRVNISINLPLLSQKAAFFPNGHFFPPPTFAATFRRRPFRRMKPVASSWL